jgi:hypothetical protein
MRQLITLGVVCLTAFSLVSAARAEDNERCKEVSGHDILTVITAPNDPMSRLLGSSIGSLKAAIFCLSNRPDDGRGCVGPRPTGYPDFQWHGFHRSDSRGTRWNSQFICDPNRGRRDRGVCGSEWGPSNDRYGIQFFWSERGSGQHLLGRKVQRQYLPAALKSKPVANAGQRSVSSREHVPRIVEGWDAG